MKARKSTQLVVKPTGPRSPLIKFKKPTGNTTTSGLYVSPYLTCTECNTVNFIEATRLSLDVLVKRGDHKDPLHAFIRSFDGEVLPECVGCKRTIHLNVGSVDFTPALIERASSFKQLFDLRQSAAVHIQRICRGRLARKEAQRRRILKEQRDRLEKWAATTIQRRIRGVISRQTTRIKSGICLIAWANPILVEKLLNDATRTPLFWFQDEDLMLVMEDYRLYVDRSGPLMTLRRFESNVVSFVHRINDMEYKMAARIQARWRGMQARDRVMELKQAISRLRERAFQAAVITQRNYRRRAHSKLSKRHSFQRHQLKIRARGKEETAKLHFSRALQRDVDHVKRIYQSYRCKTDRVADWVIPRNIPREECRIESDALSSFATTYGGGGMAMTKSMQKHKAGHIETLRQIHRFNAKKMPSPEKANMLRP
ncbi:hypothetical protein LEN26_010320 [Aphanomyces euteiches]|nr:hypothetical protein LEN26_010320 [Aphanomyces euteiches]